MSEKGLIFVLVFFGMLCIPFACCQGLLDNNTNASPDRCLNCSTLAGMNPSENIQNYNPVQIRSGKPYLSLNGTKFEDMDRDSFRDEDEPGIPGWTIRLMRNFTEVLNTTTDQSGHYIFDNLLPGSYTVIEDQMIGRNQSTPGGREYNVTLTDMSAYHLDFGNFKANVTGILPSTAANEYPVMRPSQEELQRWKEEYAKAPSAFISPKIASQIRESVAVSFSLINYLQYTPSDRVQGQSCGSCWVWTGTGIMEIDLAVKRLIKTRLSEQYLISNFNGGSGPNWGCCVGNLDGFANFYTSTAKEVPWSNANAQYQDGGKACSQSSGVSGSTISTNPSYPISSIVVEKIPTWNSEGISQATAIANIKNVLNQNKAVGLLFPLPTQADWNIFNTFWGTQAESRIFNLDFAQGTTYENAGAHWVLCVGYDDTDPNNSYWIMVNSWGTGGSNNRPNCIFRVNMNMNYGANNPGWGETFWWETLDISYPNGAPTTPSIPIGQTTGTSGTSYSYSTSANDPDGDQVKYTFDWADGTTSETSLVNSGTVASASHTWTVPAGITTKFNMRAKATDEHGLSSGDPYWSNPLSVSITGPSNGDPSVTNGVGATLVTTNSARLNGEITNTGGENPTVRIYYGLSDGSTNPGSWANYVEGTVPLGSFYTDINGLNPGTPYYYRCYASNSAGTSWASSTATFTTLQNSDARNVALRAANGQYLCAEGGGGNGVVANRNAIGGWETFKLIDRGNSNVALQAANGQYLCAEGGGGNGVVANRNAIGGWETFKLIPR